MSDASCECLALSPDARALITGTFLPHLSACMRMALLVVQLWTQQSAIKQCRKLTGCVPHTSCMFEGSSVSGQQIPTLAQVLMLQVTSDTSPMHVNMLCTRSRAVHMWGTVVHMQARCDSCSMPARYSLLSICLAAAAAASPPQLQDTQWQQQRSHLQSCCHSRRVLMRCSPRSAR